MSGGMEGVRKEEEGGKKNKGQRWRETEEGRMKDEERRDKENGVGVKSHGLQQQKQTSLLLLAPRLGIEKLFDVLIIFKLF